MTQLFTATAKLEAVRRELGYRRRVFARRVAGGRMTQAAMDHEIGVFEAIESDYAASARSELLL